MIGPRTIRAGGFASAALAWGLLALERWDHGNTWLSAAAAALLAVGGAVYVALGKESR